MATAIERFVTQREQLEKLGDWMANHSMWSLQETADYLNSTPKTVKKIPRELLPWHDLTDTEERTTRRYRQTDVFAYSAVKRAYGRAKDRGEGEEFLAKRRRQLAERDERLMSLAIDQSLDAAS